MIGALWTGISGLASQQTALDNESNNIANVNTVGYKASRISFADQMYQDRIGKGSKILDAEKLYTQGNLKLTGVNYDMALSGDGFFTVADKSSSGTSENYYTRAGNFRMGDNGTLQDSAGNEVQGWSMSAIDADNDVTSTNPNVSVFTNDYTKLLSSKVVKHSTYVETITAKATDYGASAVSDPESVFSGAGAKTKSAKISDVEAAIADYSNWLQKLKETPDGPSATSVTQVSEINFKSQDGAVANGLIRKEGDQVYVYIDGNKISQNYITTTTTDTLATADLDGSGAIDADDHNIQASRIATYKALADKISEIPGLVAYMADESSGDDVLDDTDTFEMSTDITKMGKGIIQIKSLIPGEEFIISEVGEISGNATLQGAFQNSVNAQAGSGTGALESSRDALAKLISGKQQDVYQTADLNMDGTAKSYTLNFTIYDRESKKNITIPNDAATPPVAIPLAITATTVDDFVTAFNTSTATPLVTDYLEAVNINGNLVIKTKDANYDVDFSTELKESGTSIDKNNDLSGRAGAGAEFIEIVNTVNQTSSKDSLQLRLDTLGISDSAFGEFSVDSTGLITMTQDGADFAIGQVAIAVFNNNRGLNPVGDNLLAKTNESGDPIYNLNNDKTAKIEGQTLELSTADLSESLVNLMVFQRAFEANAKSITTSDELLSTLINLKR
ncbi:MAG: flagellar hook-basal body complex protein [Aliarcobacter sp.]|jgi:flagellar hook protein FlgE|nr:flagellar hook-basal body complex protein [Aliarcobacter sp.]